MTGLTDITDLPTSTEYHLPLAYLPDGALALVLSFGTVTEIIVASAVCRSWNLEGNRVGLWQALGESFEVSMPTSLKPQFSPGAAGASSTGKRLLRSGTNGKRTFFKSYAAAMTTHRLNHDATLSEAYALFRKQDSVLRLRLLLRRRWGVTVAASSASKSTGSKDPSGELLGMGGCCKGKEGNERDPARVLQTSVTNTSKRGTGSEKGGTSAIGEAWVGKGRWTLDVNHRHGIWEGNTMLNFAVRCGRRNCVEFLLTQMGADVEISDEGGFTPLLNAAWRGDTRLLKQLLAAGASLDVKGVSRGKGPFAPLEWAEQKGRLETVAFLRRLAAGPGGNKEMTRTLKSRMTPRKRDGKSPESDESIVMVRA